MGYSPWGHKELYVTELLTHTHTHTQTHTHTHTHSGGLGSVCLGFECQAEDFKF